MRRKGSGAFQIALTRSSSVSLHTQLVTQLSLQILNGELKAGDKLPSVRALARRLNIHHNTVSAAYSELSRRGVVEVRRGSGVYVGRSEPEQEEFNELDEIIRSFLGTARRQGYSVQAIRACISRWMARQPPDHLLVVEPALDFQQLLVHELRYQLEFGVTAATPEELRAQPELSAGALVVATAYHAASVREHLPGEAEMVKLSLHRGEQEAERLKRLPVGAIVGLVSIGSTVLDYAQVMIASLRGEELLVRPVLLSQKSEWRKLTRSADLVIADSYCYDTVARFSQRPVMRLILVAEKSIRHLRQAMKAFTST